MDKIKKWIEPVAAVAIFVAFSALLLPAASTSYLWRLSELSLFVPEGEFFAGCMTRPGGLLAWAGSFLTQFFYYPWLGWALLTLLLLGLWWLVWRSAPMSPQMYAWASVPSVMLLLGVAGLGDVVFTLKSPGFAYAGVLGFASAAALWWVYRCIKPLWGRALVILLTAGLSYPFLGYYALLALALYAVGEAFGKLSDDRRTRLLVTLASVVALVIVPWLYFYLIPDNRLMECNVYTSGLPRFFSNETALYIPYAASTLLMLVAVWIGPRFSGMKARIVGAVLLLGSMAYCWSERYVDENLSVALDMERAVDSGDFKKAIAVARAQKGRPSRAVGMLTHMALVIDASAGDSLFTFAIDDDTIASRRPSMTMRQLVSRDMFMRMGRVNDAYRWCMEDMVEYGQRAEYLKIMAKCALLNGETELARKYLRPLSKTLFFKDFARKYEAYADDPDALAADPELAGIRRLMSHANILAGDASLFETYITSMTAGMVGGLPELAELSLQYNMVLKYPGGFWPRFMLYARHHERLPRHYQEAAVLFSELEHKVDWRQFNIDQVTANRFARFMDMAQRYARYSNEANRETFAPEFGDTYWYYYFFVNDLKTK